MSRFVLAVVASTTVTALALADLGPPPGQKYVSVTTTVKLEKSFPDHTFYVIGFGPGAAPLTKVDLEPTKATKVDAKSRYGGSLFAVPNAVVKEFKTEKDLAAALSNPKDKLPPGVSSVSISNRATLKVTDKRDAIDRVLVISAGDEKTGLKITEEKSAPEKKDPEEPTSGATKGGHLVLAGFATALAFLAGGFWLARRK